jgi:hypothetical protein
MVIWNVVLVGVAQALSTVGDAAARSSGSMLAVLGPPDIMAAAIIDTRPSIDSVDSTQFNINLVDLWRQDG